MRWGGFRSGSAGLGQGRVRLHGFWAAFHFVSRRFSVRFGLGLGRRRLGAALAWASSRRRTPFLRLRFSVHSWRDSIDDNLTFLTLVRFGNRKKGNKKEGNSGNRNDNWRSLEQIAFQLDTTAQKNEKKCEFSGKIGKKSVFFLNISLTFP